MKKVNEKELTKKLSLLFSVKSIDEENMIVRGIVGSDDTLDRHGDRVNPKGWDLKNYKKNPIILLNHDNHDLPIGKAISVRVSDNKLLFDVQFSKTYEKAKTVFNLVKEGIMNAVSVGFIVLEWGQAGGKYTIEKQELLELSFVTVPANPNALTNDQKELLDNFVKSIKLADEDVQKEEKNKDDNNHTKDEVKAENGATDEPKITLKDIMDKLMAIETKLNELDIAEEINNYFASYEVEDDEPQEDPKLEALLALRQELKEANKDSGKSLKLINELLKATKEVKND